MNVLVGKRAESSTFYLIYLFTHEWYLLLKNETIIFALMTGFRHCRVCLASENDKTLKLFRDNDGTKAMFFEKRFGIKVSSFWHWSRMPKIILYNSSWWITIQMLWSVMIVPQRLMGPWILQQCDAFEKYKFHKCQLFIMQRRVAFNVLLLPFNISFESEDCLSAVASQNYRNRCKGWPNISARLNE